MGESNQGTIQWGVGIICALIMAYMLYVSGGPERSYDLVAIAGMLALIAILLGHQDLLVKVLQVWRGNGPVLSEVSSGGGENGNGNGNGDAERSAITQQILEDIRREQRQRARQHANPETDRGNTETEEGEEG